MNHKIRSSSLTYIRTERTDQLHKTKTQELPLVVGFS